MMFFFSVNIFLGSEIAPAGNFFFITKILKMFLH